MRISEDYDDILFDLLGKACAAGMPPNEFWETEPADTIAFINAQAEERYNISIGLAQNIIACLGNAMSKHPKRDLFPSFDELQLKSLKEQIKKEMSQQARLDARVEELRRMFAGKNTTK